MNNKCKLLMDRKKYVIKEGGDLEKPASYKYISDSDSSKKGHCYELERGDSARKPQIKNVLTKHLTASKKNEDEWKRIIPLQRAANKKKYERFQNPHRAAANDFRKLIREKYTIKLNASKSNKSGMNSSGTDAKESQSVEIDSLLAPGVTTGTNVPGFSDELLIKKEVTFKKDSRCLLHKASEVFYDNIRKEIKDTRLLIKKQTEISNEPLSKIRDGRPLIKASEFPIDPIERRIKDESQWSCTPLIQKASTEMKTLEKREYFKNDPVIPKKQNIERRPVSPLKERFRKLNVPQKIDSEIKNAERKEATKNEPVNKDNKQIKKFTSVSKPESDAKHQNETKESPKSEAKAPKLDNKDVKLSKIDTKDTKSLKLDGKEAKMSKADSKEQRAQRKPMIKTVSIKNGHKYKAVTFVDKQDVKPLEIKVPIDFKKSDHKGLKKEKTSKSTISTGTDKESKMPTRLSKRRFRFAPMSPGVIRGNRSPPTEVAKWVPSSLTGHTQPYYEAWIDTTLAAVSKYSQKEKDKVYNTLEQQRLARIQSPELIYENMMDERYTGRIKIKQK